MLIIFQSLSCQRQHEAGQKESNVHNHDSTLLIGNVKNDDVVKEVNEPSYIDSQQRLM